jgi:hypothetical protein
MSGLNDGGEGGHSQVQILQTWDLVCVQCDVSSFRQSGHCINPDRAALDPSPSIK